VNGLVTCGSRSHQNFTNQFSVGVTAAIRVDRHRTVALAIWPSVKRGVVDANLYPQLSMARTIQDILHVEPQTHFLKASRAMNSVFTADKDLSPYSALTPKIALDTMNPPLHSLTGKRLDAARRSAAMNWNHVDDVPTPVLNQILWWNSRGYDQTVPAARSQMETALAPGSGWPSTRSPR
jgi:hypothetical protein